MKRRLLFLFAMLAIMSQSLFADPPTWTAPTNLQYNMQVIAKLQIADGPVYSSSSSDIVGAFVNNVVRGVASPGVDEIVYLTILSDAVSGETINLQAYIAVGDVIYPVKVYPSATDALNGTNEVTSLEFASNAILGSYTTPYIFVASPAIWTITPSAGTGGTITPGLPTDVVEGANQSFTMEPATGYHFTSIMVDNLSDADPAFDVFDENLLEADGSFIYEFTNVTNDWAIVASFAINTYTLSFTAGTNGTLSGPDPLNAPLGDLVTASITGATQLLYENVPYGTSFGIVTAVPNGGYEFAAWSDDENAVAARPAITVIEDINATATFAPSGWTPDNNYQFTMSVIGQLIIDGSVSTNTSDLVGAFVGGDCRGVASPDVNGIVFLSIGSDLASGEDVVLKIWDSSTGADCIAAHGFSFLSNQQLGTISNPYVIECQISLEKTIPVGYTWFSANIETNSNTNPWNPNNYFEDAWFTDGTYTVLGNGSVVDDRIIGQTSFAVFATTGTGDQWVGSLTTMSAKKMYRLFMKTGSSTRYLKLTGSAVANTPITLNAGYTWLGYIPREDLPIGTALASFTGLVAGDRIISQNKFAIYNGTIWQGSLVTMSPGKGYIVQMANGGTLTYPDYVYAKSVAIAPENEVSPAGFEVPTNMKNTMTLIGHFDKTSFSDKDVVYAFINGECRGMAATSADGNIYLNIGDNSDATQEVSFKVWVDATGELANVDQKVTFEPLKAVGDLNNPFTFKMSEANTNDSWLVGAAYPNPFNDQTIIPLWLKESAQVTVNVYNGMGQVVKKVAESAAKTGVSNIVLQKENLKAGIYYYTVTVQSASNSLHENGKLIIQ